MIRKIACAVACTLTLVSTSFAADSYPRTGAVLIGGAQDYWTASYQAAMAKLQVVVLSSYPGWGSGHGTSSELVTKQLKARNPNLKVFLYVQNAGQPNPVPTVWKGLGTKLDAQKWWLYQTWGSGTKVTGTGLGNVLNITNYTTRDSSGLRYNQWMARYLATNVGKAAPTADGLYTDCVFWRPRTNGDYNQDGRVDSANDPAVGSWVRQGYGVYVDELRAQLPGKLQIANAADWGQSNAVLDGLSGEFNGGVMEGIIGKSYSMENLTGGWALMMAQYRKTMAAMASPKLGLFMMAGSPTDYQGMRYGLGSASMDDGYFTFKNEATGYYGAVYFDEYGAKLGAATTGPQKSAWQAGVYRRDFQNGIILVNPKGNGARTVNLGGTFRKLKGTQAPSINNGALVTSVTLKDRDGIVLLRQ